MFIIYIDEERIGKKKKKKVSGEENGSYMIRMGKCSNTNTYRGFRASATSGAKF